VARNNAKVTPESLVRAVESFLTDAKSAVVFEDGAIAFDLAEAKYSISGERNKCLLHMWSSERNVVRRVLDAEIKKDGLSLSVQRMGQTRATKLEICRERDRRTPTAKRAARVAYQKELHRVLNRRFPGFTILQLSTAMDLERSFGPIYARGILKQGVSGFAILGVNAHETQASIDAALTFGILWLDACRQSHAGKLIIEGLKLFLPPESSALTRERIAHLHPSLAKWRLYELHELESSLREIDVSDRGNVATRLVHAPDEIATYERFSGPLAQIHELMPEAEIAILSAAEVAFRCHGLEFARARLTQEPGSFRNLTEVVFGIGAQERVLCDQNMGAFQGLVRSIGEVRHTEGPRDSQLWRMHPERWLESLAVQNISALDGRLEPTRLYSQVPAFSASDRAMIDVLTTTRDRRLAVVELKADEDIHLPLQGLDYWARVAWHHQRREFQKFGYFPAKELSPKDPLLFLVAPTLRIHPSTDTLLRYLSPKVSWTLIGIDERWRTNLKPIFRKRSAREDLPDAGLEVA